MLQGRRVLLCVTGGVAAYKSAYLARRLVEAGATVRVEMTESALEFVGAQTFAAITGERPFTALFAADLVDDLFDLHGILYGKGDAYRVPDHRVVISASSSDMA